MDIVELPPLGRRVEWPTIGLAVVVYGWWGLATWFWRDLPAWALVPLGAWVIAWQMNLQHEVIHGHPTPWRAVNDAIGVWPLSLWLPFTSYRETHIRHHQDANLTDPFEDPESYYWTSAGWRDLGAIGRALYAAQSTLLGRLLLGPALMIGRFVVDLLRDAWRGKPGARLVVFWHLAECVPVLAWVIGVCGMPLWVYVAAFVYPGMSLAMVRSFAEHRAAQEPEKRTAIVENAPVLGLLFLNNNLHVAHHLRGGVPWYQLPRFYRMNRETLIKRNGGLVYDGYLDVVRRYALKPQDRLVHPDWTGRAA
ncbi:MAG TPA: fatty acid desaturase [Roseiarcus sp.]|nr:fatty acid desaturase [Roseiarcus sp.]